MKPLDFTKPIQTRDGRKVRILCTDGNGEYPIAGYIENHPTPTTWLPDGRMYKNTEMWYGDLINPPIKRKVEFWVNTFDDDFMVWYTKEQADGHNRGRIACLHFVREYEEGEGL